MAPAITLQQRMEIIAMRENGYRFVEISRKLKIARKTVYFWVDRYQREGSLAPHTRFDYDRATTMAQDDQIVALHRADPTRSTKQTAREFNVSIETVRRRLKMAEYQQNPENFNKVIKMDNSHKKQIKELTTKIKKRIKRGYSTSSDSEGSGHECFNCRPETHTEDKPPIKKEKTEENSIEISIELPNIKVKQEIIEETEPNYEVSLEIANIKEETSEPTPDFEPGCKNLNNNIKIKEERLEEEKSVATDSEFSYEISCVNIKNELDEFGSVGVEIGH